LQVDSALIPSRSVVAESEMMETDLFLLLTGKWFRWDFWKLSIWATSSRDSQKFSLSF